MRAECLRVMIAAAGVALVLAGCAQMPADPEGGGGIGGTGNEDPCQTVSTARPAGCDPVKKTKGG